MRAHTHINYSHVLDFDIERESESEREREKERERSSFLSYVYFVSDAYLARGAIVPSWPKFIGNFKYWMGNEKKTEYSCEIIVGVFVCCSKKARKKIETINCERCDERKLDD